MSCNQEFFQKEEQVIKTAGYASNVLSGSYDNVDFWTYTASTDGKYHINKNRHRLEVPSGDGLFDTFEKTQKAFRLLIEAKFRFDYILRTNLSTHITVWLLQKFINGIPESEKDTIFSSRVYCDRYATGPEEFSFYAVGNSMILPRSKVELIAYSDIDEIKKFNKVPLDEKETIYHIDDNMIGLLVNQNAIENGKDPHFEWKQFLSFGVLTPQTLNYKNISSHITVPFRAYDVEDREKLEFWLAEKLNKLTVIPPNVNYITPEHVYNLNTRYDLITLTDFINRKCIELKREYLDYFLNNREKFSNDLEKFINFAKQRFSNKV